MAAISIDILWELLAGLGLFLLGMLSLEQGLKALGTRSFKFLLRNQTKTPIRGVLTGTFASAFLQSSSIVGLMVLAFVGAGIMEMRNALGVIFGTNLGTTLTGWIVTVLGFKLDLAKFALPIVAVGALGVVFTTKTAKAHFVLKVCLGLGLLLLGLSYMKGAVDELPAHFNLSWLKDYPVIAFLIAGAIFTAIIQSSSAAVMIVLSALNAGIVELDSAAAMVIGADLGTTSTVLLGALKGTADKRRVALSHFLFNLVTDLLAFILLLPFIKEMQALTGVNDPLYSLVLFHSFFNLVGITLFVPFVDRFEKLLYRLIKREDSQICNYIFKVPTSVTEPAIEAVQKDTDWLLFKVLALDMRCFKLMAEPVFDKTELEAVKRVLNAPHLSYEDEYAQIKEAEGELLAYIFQLQRTRVSELQSKNLMALHQTVSNLAYSAKTVKDVRQNLIDMRHSAEQPIHALYDELVDYIKHLYRGLSAYHGLTHKVLLNEKETELNSYILDFHHRLSEKVTHVGQGGKLDDTDLTTLVNVNRSILLSSLSLLEAVKLSQNHDYADEAVALHLN